ncbi:hypothetical protein C5167_033340 [Papaver somniferum]|uniref:Endoplasmic reticulum transmembrane protein n=1 Tax=Papaver somniferum TaxID=3469 RepID=A0A4Y7KDJ8_PAPSO|nr:hypothetical protein C5167_033340 [Papaver somniferum]
MALQWLILAYVVAAEAVIALLLTLPSPKLVKSRIVSLISLILQPAIGIVPFAAFQLLDIYWKNEHRLMCTSDVCTAAERDRYEKSYCNRNFMNGTRVDLIRPSWWWYQIYKSQRNVILCTSACLLYWSVYRICNYHKDVQNLEEVEKRYKEQ